LDGTDKSSPEVLFNFSFLALLGRGWARSACDMLYTCRSTV
jgi:hypothetical protein